MVVFFQNVDAMNMQAHTRILMQAHTFFCTFLSSSPSPLFLCFFLLLRAPSPSWSCLYIVKGVGFWAVTKEKKAVWLWWQMHCASSRSHEIFRVGGVVFSVFYVCMHGGVIFRVFFSSTRFLFHQNGIISMRLEKSWEHGMILLKVSYVKSRWHFSQ